MAVSYPNGVRTVDGKPVAAKFRKHFRSSNGVTLYTAVLWEDGGTSCDCPGWVNNHSKGSTCKHAKEAARLTQNELFSTSDATSAALPMARAERGVGRGFDL